ncbi:odorant receptor 30a-like [Anopheles maculipalpis]|uniref:odorant receptor 30a-like n=1 Tax=Anopheles maculipalpis TaxID=1496333 RepID=UPI0021591D29|nr:odorant receptor 30a-like [Anopheles maculipalpis]
MSFFRRSHQYLELGYNRIYEVFHWFLRITLLRIFDDDFLATPITTALFQFYVSEIVISLGAVAMHIVRYRTDLDTVILSVSAFAAALEVFLKLNGMVYRRKEIRQMIGTVLNDRSYLNGSLEAAICGKYMRLARKLLFITILSYLTTATMLLIYPILSGGLRERILPVGFSIPFVDYRKDPWYMLNYVLQIVQVNWVALVFVGLDGPFYLFVCYSASQLEILIVYLRQIGQSPDDVEEQRRLIRKVYAMHTELSKFLSKCSYIYREVYLMQVLCSITHICVSLFHIQLKLKNGSYGMLLTNVNKMWLFCYCGELVVSKAADFSTAVYTNQWYQLWNRPDLQDVLFMLQNAQRNYGFSVGGFGFLSFALFTAVMKTAYSCNAFLHRVMN